jgi:ABC-type phosphate/phosphonate transport system substrate-binding protein
MKMYFTYRELAIIFLLLVYANTYLYSQSNNAADEKIVNATIGISDLVLQDVKKEDANAAIYVWSQALKKELSLEVNQKYNLTSLIYNSVEEIESALNKNEVDVLTLTITDYFTLKEKYNLVPSLVGIVNNSPYSQYILLIHNDSNINNVSDLFQKNLIQPKDKYHPLIDMWINSLLPQKTKADIKSFFRKVIYADKQADAVYSVFFKKADCAIIQKNVFNTICLLNSQFKNSLKIIQTSPELLITVTASRKNCSEKVKELLNNIATNIFKTPSGRNIMNLFKQERLIEITDKELEGTKKLIDQYYTKGK